jgi:hypothetical protein
MPELTDATGSIIPYWLRLLDRVTAGLAPSDTCSTSRSSAAA